jgi:hypothetical protein
MLDLVITPPSTKDAEYFPSDYSDSRRAFLERAMAVEGPKELGQWLVPASQDDDLVVDHLYLPPLALPKTLVVLSSGVHGIEAYAGSAIQTMFFEELLPKIDRAHTGIFLVHSLNPFGFKHHRRGTEANINLNRNFFAKPELYQRKNEASREMHDKFVQKTPVTSARSHLLQQMRMENGGVLFGAGNDAVSLDRLVKAVAPGQFDSPENLEYGGTKPEPQSQALIDWLKAQMPVYRDIVLLDLHTGLGKRGRLHLLGSGNADEINQELFHQLFKPEADKEFYEFTSADADGFYDTYGTLNGIFPQLAHPKQRVCAVTMEFGTLGHDNDAQLESMNRWLIDHQGLLYGYANTALQAKAESEFLEKFYPNDNHWKQKVIDAARGLLTRAFARMAST